MFAKGTRSSDARQSALEAKYGGWNASPRDSRVPIIVRTRATIDDHHICPARSAPRSARLRARPAPARVTFLNGRKSDISIWWTQSMFRVVQLGQNEARPIVGWGPAWK